MSVPSRSRMIPFLPAPAAALTRDAPPVASLHRLPLGYGLLQLRVAHQEMPHDGAEALRVRRDALGRYGRDDDARVRALLGAAPVAPDDAEHLRAHLFG